MFKPNQYILLFDIEIVYIWILKTFKLFNLNSKFVSMYYIKSVILNTFLILQILIYYYYTDNKNQNSVIFKIRFI